MAISQAIQALIISTRTLYTPAPTDQQIQRLTTNITQLYYFISMLSMISSCNTGCATRDRRSRPEIERLCDNSHTIPNNIQVYERVQHDVDTYEYDHRLAHTTRSFFGKTQMKAADDAMRAIIPLRRSASLMRFDRRCLIHALGLTPVHTLASECVEIASAESCAGCVSVIEIPEMSS